jgi:hypothetical protein
MRLNTWASLLKRGIISTDQALATVPLVCLLKTPHQSFAWCARNHGKWGFGKKIRSLRQVFSTQH